MRICVVTLMWHEYNGGGIETYLANYEEYLKRTPNVEAIFLVPNIESKKNIVEKKGNIEIHKLPFLSRMTTVNAYLYGKRLFKYLNDLIKKENIDIIETENISWNSNYAIAVNLAAMQNEVPFVERLHAFPDQIRTQMMKGLFFDKIFPVSRKVAEELLNSGIKIQRIEAQNPGVNLNIFREKETNLKSKLNIPDENLVMVHASRIISTSTGKDSVIEEKGIPTLLKAISLVKETIPHLSVIIATAKPHPKRIKKFDKAIKQINNLATIYGVEENILIKQFSLEEMGDVYNTADIYVMASQIESFGLVYVEAMACGVPVIGTSVGGVPEIISNSSDGYLVEPDNHVELSKRMLWLAEDHDKRKQMGRNGKEKVRAKFSLEITFKDLLEEYEKIIKQR